MVFRSETELEKAAIPFFEDNYVNYLPQVPLHDRQIDFAAIDSFGHIFAIEFKLRDWKRALEQALNNRNAVDFAYICVPGGRYMEKLIDVASNIGIGVMVYDNCEGSVKIELKAQKNEKKWIPNFRYLREFLTKGGVSGY